MSPRNVIALAVAVLLVLGILLGLYWSQEPDVHKVKMSSNQPVGYATLNALIRSGETLLEKQGGYLSNDIGYPSIFLDNIPNWEFGAVVQLRDFTRALRRHFSRSQSQSAEDKNLAVADPKFHFDHARWAFPSTESQYRQALYALKDYQQALTDPDDASAQFYARADNLRAWLEDVEKSLGSLSQRLTASVGQKRINTDLAGDSAAQQSTETEKEVFTKTPWSEVDDVFYQTRGATWVLVNLLRAIEIDFRPVLEKKNALVSLRQIIRELEATQATVWSPMIMNGGGFGFVANHSLVMASYVARANAAVIDLRDLLAQG